MMRKIYCVSRRLSMLLVASLYQVRTKEILSLSLLADKLEAATRFLYAMGVRSGEPFLSFAGTGQNSHAAAFGLGRCHRQGRHASSATRLPLRGFLAWNFRPLCVGTIPCQARRLLLDRHETAATLSQTL